MDIRLQEKKQCHQTRPTARKDHDILVIDPCIIVMVIIVGDRFPELRLPPCFWIFQFI